MEAKTIGNYGGVYVDQRTVVDPESEMAAAYGNRFLEDLAQATRTVERASVDFLTSAAAAAALPPATISFDSVWGSSAAEKPVVAKTAQGLYTITFAVSFTDGLAVSENVSFRRGVADAMSADSLDDCVAQILTIASNVITLKTEAPAGTLADVGDNSGNPFQITVFLR